MLRVQAAIHAELTGTVKSCSANAGSGVFRGLLSCLRAKSSACTTNGGRYSTSCSPKAVVSCIYVFSNYAHDSNAEGLPGAAQGEIQQCTIFWLPSLLSVWLLLQRLSPPSPAPTPPKQGNDLQGRGPQSTPHLLSLDGMISQFRRKRMGTGGTPAPSKEPHLGKKLLFAASPGRLGV